MTISSSSSSSTEQDSIVGSVEFTFDEEQRTNNDVKHQFSDQLQQKLGQLIDENQILRAKIDMLQRKCFDTINQSQSNEEQ